MFDEEYGGRGRWNGVKGGGYLWGGIGDGALGKRVSLVEWGF